MALKRADLRCEAQLEQLIFKMTPVCLDTSPEPLPKSKDGLVDWLLRQISPDNLKYRLEFRFVPGFGLVDSVSFQHCPPNVVVKRVEVR